ncbi:MAG TPA: DUF4136 domain-containing protein [Cyclobacteriaceae bacterium]|nr:DUF4136 domain-containing protein [Cyclobacteriaceae bacterium]
MKSVLLILTGATLVLWGCQPKPSDAELLKNLVVFTDKSNNTTNYTQYSTYYLRPDTMNYYNSSDPNPADTLWLSSQSGDFVDYVTKTVNDSLTARGYSSVSRKSSPDLKVYIYEVENYSVSYSYYPYSYGYGYGYGGYGYGGGYTTASVSDQADLYIQILDVKHLTSGKPTLIWYCDIGDIASLSSADTFIRALGQAFKQSPYLKK